MSNSSASKYCPECKRVSTGEQFYTKLFYKNREIVFERDENKCQCCGCEEDNKELNKLIIHHIDVNRLNNSLSNLITLCTQCHLSLHAKYSKLILRRSNIYKLFAEEKQFGEFGKNLIYGPAKKIVKKQFKGKPKLFFKIKNKT
jgi:5-methylcytosine-specific restriction endonuclease McrA